MTAMPVEPGVSRALARERAERVSDLRYAVRLRVDADPASPIRSTLHVTFRMSRVGAPLQFDFAPDGRGRLDACRVNGIDIPPRLDREHIVIAAEALRVGINEVAFTFLAGEGALHRRDAYVYTIFVPARAREVFPCFDQPDLRARWTLTLEIPAGWRAVSNAEAASSDRGIVSFGETEPIPTYLFAFAAGELEEISAVAAGRRMRLYHRCGDRALLARNADAIVEAHDAAIRWLEAYTAVAFPFSKLDAVLVPAFQFGGMEHPGAIFYNETALLLTESATEQQSLARASLIAHETAHLWFGDLVTLPWFDDVWMKEVFANFMGAKIVNPQFPQVNHDLRFLHAHYPAAYDVDRTAGTNAIRQPLENLNDAASLYGAIVYQKSPIVMRLLEMKVGEA
jgi:aminopeptidase N